VARPKLTDTRVLWPALLAAPVAWVVQLQGMFSLSAWATEEGNRVPLHVVSALCLLVALCGGYLAHRAWRTVGGWPMGTEAPDAARVRYLTVLGMMTSALFVCVIVAQWVAVVMLPDKMGGG
jgi:hypothetical protein